MSYDESLPVVVGDGQMSRVLDCFRSVDKFLGAIDYSVLPYSGLYSRIGKDEWAHAASSGSRWCNDTERQEVERFFDGLSIEIGHLRSGFVRICDMITGGIVLEDFTMMWPEVFAPIERWADGIAFDDCPSEVVQGVFSRDASVSAIADRFYDALACASQGYVGAVFCLFGEFNNVLPIEKRKGLIRPLQLYVFAMGIFRQFGARDRFVRRYEDFCREFNLFMQGGDNGQSMENLLKVAFEKMEKRFLAGIDQYANKVDAARAGQWASSDGAKRAQLREAVSKYQEVVQSGRVVRGSIRTICLEVVKSGVADGVKVGESCGYSKADCESNKEFYRALDRELVALGIKARNPHASKPTKNGSRIARNKRR